MRIANSELFFSGIFVLVLGISFTLFLICDSIFDLSTCKMESGNPRNLIIVLIFIGGFLMSMGLGRKEKMFYTNLRCPMPPRDFIFLSMVLSIGLLVSVFSI